MLVHSYMFKTIYMEKKKKYILPGVLYLGDLNISLSGVLWRSAMLLLLLRPLLYPTCNKINKTTYYLLQKL